MPIHIENERVSSLDLQLSIETGESISQAARSAGDLMEIGRSCVSHAPADWLAKDFDEELYDELGMPR